MLYHARALAASGVEVDLVGFEGTPVPKTISGDPRISIHRLNPATLRRGAFSGSTYAVAGLLDAALGLLGDEIAPIDDIRSTAVYRRRVAANLVASFWSRSKYEV